MREVNTPKRASIALVGASLLAGACASPNEVDPAAAARDLAAACARSVCRTEVRQLVLNADNGRFELMTDRLPYTDNGAVSIFPGEALIVEFADNSSVDRPRFVSLIDRVDIAGQPATEAGSGARPTMAFELRQEPGMPTMTLEIKSTLDVMVKFDATMWMPTPNGIRVGHTSSCPVFAKAGGVQTWPHPIAMLLLTNFRVQPLSGNIVCQ